MHVTRHLPPVTRQRTFASTMASGSQKSAAPLKTSKPTARVVPDKLCAGDEVRILALSRSIGGLKVYPGISDADIEFARKGLEALGLRVSFGRHVMECCPLVSTHRRCGNRLEFQLTNV
jgi:hypothetical protein